MASHSLCICILVDVISKIRVSRGLLHILKHSSEHIQSTSPNHQSIDELSEQEPIDCLSLAVHC